MRCHLHICISLRHHWNRHRKHTHHSFTRSHSSIHSFIHHIHEHRSHSIRTLKVENDFDYHDDWPLLCSIHTIISLIKWIKSRYGNRFKWPIDHLCLDIKFASITINTNSMTTKIRKTFVQQNWKLLIDTETHIIHALMLMHVTII